ncbi:sigma factor G inhibitor Gin [Paenibacillus sp. IB182496]|uniref:Sigma factor G inhibitor Gin n=1 Tax=Paenibacillus sabuli TaxID=2772509 RepID=A0A927BWV7_9BACL|nr:sigma factor G inhibitor Gin [Paenibacillus sabuli]MBD2848337.1 sigma factor G inhibitor Gin [Paenibacillus sabuli]
MHEDHDHTCIICGNEKQDGIRIVTEFICESCEAEMVNTDVQDAKYPFFIHRLKQIWLQKNA